MVDTRAWILEYRFEHAIIRVALFIPRTTLCVSVVRVVEGIVTPNASGSVRLAFPRSVNAKYGTLVDVYEAMHDATQMWDLAAANA